MTRSRQHGTKIVKAVHAAYEKWDGVYVPRHLNVALDRLAGTLHTRQPHWCTRTRTVVTDGLVLIIVAITVIRGRRNWTRAGSTGACNAASQQ